MDKIKQSVTGTWAQEEFGSAKLGDQRRNKRLVLLAEGAANRPAGGVTAVFGVTAAREGAFRLLENDAVATAEVGRASHLACARRAAATRDDFVFVPIDGTSLNIVDRGESKGLGTVGTRRQGARGLEVMTAIALGADGTPLGLCGQRYWAREQAVGTKRHRTRRKLDQKETRHWLDVMGQVRSVFASEAPQVKPWFQLDRGADAWPVLLRGLEHGESFTVRAAQDRRLTMQQGDEQRRYLWETMEGLPLRATKDLQIPALPWRGTRHGKTRPPRAARTAKIELRWARVSLDLLVGSKRRRQAPLWAILACETAESASGEEPVEWLLLTSRHIRSRRDAELVLYGYSQRWRIEQFHKAWKTDHCNVEDTQLRAHDNIVRWAMVLASVAMRSLRLQYLARTTPDAPASVELTRAEIDAVILMAERPTKGPRAGKNYKPGAALKMGEIVELIARIGGYTGRSSGGPPGARVISRGLERITVLASALALGVVVPAKK